ncbi:hypothetical protein AR000_15155 [Listeria monocytogenes]|nr:hypothetical protein [Listeria monocytogenes]
MNYFTLLDQSNNHFNFKTLVKGHIKMWEKDHRKCRSNSNRLFFSINPFKGVNYAKRCLRRSLATYYNRY